MANNVFGEPLISCSQNPLTGYFRDGCCNTDETDSGLHTICIIANEDFLQFSYEAGNDLSTPMPQFGFPGLKAGDQWCVCAQTWHDACEEGVACPVVLESTHEETLQITTIQLLEQYAHK
mgnify:CR=1 FL=1